MALTPTKNELGPIGEAYQGGRADYMVPLVDNGSGSLTPMKSPGATGGGASEATLAAVLAALGSPVALQPWRLFAYADTQVAGGLPHVLDSATYAGIGSLVDGVPAELGTTDVFAVKIPAGYSQARVRVLCQDGASSADNDTATIEIGTLPALVDDGGTLYGIVSMLTRAVLTWGTMALSTQTKEPFTRTALSGSSTLREADGIAETRQWSGPDVTFGYAADNGAGEIQLPLEFASYVLFTWQARSNTDTGRLIAGIQFER